MDRRVCVIWVQRPRPSECVLVSVFSITSARACVWLTRFPHGPSGNRREWPPQTPPRHPPFPVGRKKDAGNSTAKIFMLFPLYSMLQGIVTATWRQRPMRPNTPLHGLQCYPKVLSEQNLTNTCKHTCTHTHIRRLKQTKKANSWWLLSFHWTAILWGCLHSGPIKAFMVQPISPGGFADMWVCDWRHNQGQFLDLYQQSRASRRWVCLTAACILNTPRLRENCAAVTTWSISGALCLWVACIFNIAEG